MVGSDVGFSRRRSPIPRISLDFCVLEYVSVAQKAFSLPAVTWMTNETHRSVRQGIRIHPRASIQVTGRKNQMMNQAPLGYDESHGPYKRAAAAQVLLQSYKDQWFNP